MDLTFASQSVFSPLKSTVPGSGCVCVAEESCVIEEDMQKKPPKAKANINTAAAQLRALIWSKDEGTLLGSEDDLTALLDVSRPTVRQVARLLEQEGLLRVRRGINGGYFAARPSVEVIENSVSSYLQMVKMDIEDVTEVASALWVVAVKKIAASATAVNAREVLEPLRTKVMALTEDDTFSYVTTLEKESRALVFTTMSSPYIELIFHINITFMQQQFQVKPYTQDGTAAHKTFVMAWKKAKLLEIDTICEGDVALAEMAARHSRSIFHKRLWS